MERMSHKGSTTVVVCCRPIVVNTSSDGYVAVIMVRRCPMRKAGRRAANNGAKEPKSGETSGQRSDMGTLAPKTAETPGVGSAKIWGGLTTILS